MTLLIEILFVAGVWALVCSAAALTFGDPCSQPTDFKAPFSRAFRFKNECYQQGAQSFCLKVEGENRCLRANNDFLGACSLSNFTGCRKNNIGLSPSGDYECSGGRCAHADGHGKICENDDDCPTPASLVEELGDRCTDGKCFTCFEAEGEKRCRVYSNMGDSCAGEKATKDSWDYGACTEGFKCDMEAFGAERGAGICVNPNEPPGALGSNCFKTGIKCPQDKGLFCIRTPRLRLVDGVYLYFACTKLAKLGEYCNDEDSVQINRRVVCNLNLPGEKFPQVPWVCTNNVCSEPPSTAGSPCSKALGFDCDDGCGEERTTFCESGSDPAFRVQEDVERCVAYDIPVGKSCRVGPYLATRRCVKGSGCKIPPFPFPSGFASGTCTPFPR